MTGTRTPSLVPRLAGVFFLLVGLGSLVAALLAPGGGAADGPGHDGLWWIVSFSLLVALGAFTIPWDALPPPVGLSLPVAALLLLVLVEQLSDYSATRQAAAVYPLYVVAVLTWVGLTQPRATAAAFGLCTAAALAYVLLRSRDPSLPPSSVLVIVPVGAVLGETCAWLSKRVDVLARRENRRANDLEQLTRLAGQLPGLASAQEAADLVARAAVDLFDGAAVSVKLSDADGAPVLAEAGDDADTRAGTATQVSLVGRTQVIGVVHLGLRTDDEDPGGYTANLTRLFASQVGNALEQFQLINRLNRAAHRDELTGTGNRRHADALLDSLRPNDALLIVDLDHFKSVNDNLGHRAGDEVLQALGSYLLSYVRGSDDVARYGGDEFVVLARGAGTEARATAERLLLGWRGSGNSTTISIGVALHFSSCTPEATLDAADAALYRAKSQGRDRVALDATATTA
jgi:diguanylate cyclase (GGDEF)-like protein